MNQYRLPPSWRPGGPGRPWLRGQAPPPAPAAGKHGWSKHGSSTIPSKHPIPQDLYSPCLNLTNYARTMFTPTMFSRGRYNQMKSEAPTPTRLEPQIISFETQLLSETPVC